MKKILFIFIALILPCVGLASEAPKATSFTLSNGMEVVVVPNTKMPVISHMVWYKIGSSDEQPGKSGIAHFLEHLMFKATGSYKSGEFSKKVSKVGGNDNAFTDNDYTAYYQNIPKAALPLVMELEAARMQDLKFNTNEVLKERDVILEERRMRIDSRPASLLGEQMKAALFLNHPYGRPIIGWYHEMEGLTIGDAEAWHKDYYNPANAVLVVSGDIIAEELRPLAEKYYGKIPSGKRAERNKYLQEPPHIAPILVKFSDSKVKKEELVRYYIAPSRIYGKKEYSYALLMLSYLLGGSDTSILYQDMIVKNKKAVAVGSYYDDMSMGPSIFVMQATPVDGVALPQLEELFDANIKNIIKNGVNEVDLARAKKATIAQSIYEREDLKTLAYKYGQAAALGLKMDYVDSFDKEIGAVTAADIKEAAKYVLNEKNVVTGYLLPDNSGKTIISPPSSGHAKNDNNGGGIR